MYERQAIDGSNAAYGGLRIQVAQPKAIASDIRDVLAIGRDAEERFLESIEVKVRDCKAPPARGCAAKVKSVVGDWQRSLRKLFSLANINDGHAHRFRDTFATELLLAGVPLERASILLGHQSVKVTERHYAPWVRARQEQLETDVRRTWGEQPPDLASKIRTRNVREHVDPVN